MVVTIPHVYRKKDYGEWVFAHGKEVTGVILIGFSVNARRTDTCDHQPLQPSPL